MVESAPFGVEAASVPRLVSVPPATARVTAEPSQPRWALSWSWAFDATVPPATSDSVSWFGQDAVMSRVMGGPVPLASPSVRLATSTDWTALRRSHRVTGDTPPVMHTLSVSTGTPSGLQFSGFHQS